MLKFICFPLLTAARQGGRHFSEAVVPPHLKFLVFLTASNIFMTFAWYGHLKTHLNRPLWIAIMVSWGIAFFEYCLQVPGNRAGSQVMSLSQLKISQEVITLAVFVPFSIYYMGEAIKWDYLWAALCLMGAVYFVFRS